MSFVAYAVAILAALSNAASNVLQRRANREESPELAFSPKLIWELAHRRVWLAGIGAVILSFLLQATALDFGRLSAVQPVIILELPLTLIGAMIFLNARMDRMEWVAAALMTAGVVAVLAGLDPRGDAHHVGAVTWLVGIGGSVGVIGVLVAIALRLDGARRGALLGAATGVGFGLTAALMKAMTQSISHGITGILTSWATYAMVAAGIGSMFLMQTALQSGRLVTAQPGITLLDPVTAIVWGTLAFRERTNSGPMLVVAILGGVALAVGAIVLSRSAALSDEEEAEEGEERPAPT